MLHHRLMNGQSFILYSERFAGDSKGISTDVADLDRVVIQRLAVMGDREELSRMVHDSAASPYDPPPDSAGSQPPRRGHDYGHEYGHDYGPYPRGYQHNVAQVYQVKTEQPPLWERESSTRPPLGIWPGLTSSRTLCAPCRPPFTDRSSTYPQSPSHYNAPHPYQYQHPHPHYGASRPQHGYGAPSARGPPMLNPRKSARARSRLKRAQAWQIMTVQHPPHTRPTRPTLLARGASSLTRRIRKDHPLFTVLISGGPVSTALRACAVMTAQLTAKLLVTATISVPTAGYGSSQSPGGYPSSYKPQLPIIPANWTVSWAVAPDNNVPWMYLDDALEIPHSEYLQSVHNAAVYPHSYDGLVAIDLDPSNGKKPTADDRDPAAWGRSYPTLPPNEVIQFGRATHDFVTMKGQSVDSGYFEWNYSCALLKHGTFCRHRCETFDGLRGSHRLIDRPYSASTTSWYLFLCTQRTSPIMSIAGLPLCSPR